MATFKLRANELSGLTGLSVRIYAEGSSTIANGAGGDSLSETGSSDGQFTATVAETLTGAHDYYVYQSGNPIYYGKVNADGSVLIADEPTISPSDVGKRTGYLICYDENGVVEANADVTCQCYYAPDTGLALDSATRTETSDGDGLVQFTNLIVGAKYKVKRGVGDWDSKSYAFTVASGSGSFAIDSIVGRDEA